MLSAAITLVILGIAAGVTIAVQSATDTYVGGGLGVLVGMIAVLILMPTAYPPGERQWWRWICAGYVVLVWLAFLAWIPLILLPWLAVTKKRWIWQGFDPDDLGAAP